MSEQNNQEQIEAVPVAVQKLHVSLTYHFLSLSILKVAIKNILKECERTIR